ncbi:Ribosomal-protein-serine acetyltransferase [Sinorhizobium sojae CCBAU 05684]|uniref:Ribosomal-protein-serine acetyltransferase n=1 Tax=Sinorhizobium sojae CCBAU 05684 TaxID=716928 RepID=A0A249PEH8_9HYPH|nr:GNAT family protein [Sinorhizobium sojae]ASY64328.1 Ribosomal-protein-serine acetyltransferase [Sinorhizobium sojae CCBAU 05684]
MRDLANWTACPAPQPVTIEGRYVRLEAYDRAAHLEALWHDAFGGLAINPLLKYFTQDDFSGIEDFGAWLSAVQTKSGWITEVFRDRATDKVVGMANYMRADAANGVVEVGGVAHGPAMARSALSTEAHYLMARHVFEDLGYRRYEWKCHSENQPSRTAALRLGFTFEGIFRQHMISKHANRDTAWYSIIDREWPPIRTAFETWLSPGNFDGEGHQRRRLEDIRAELSVKEQA